MAASEIHRALDEEKRQERMSATGRQTLKNSRRGDATRVLIPRPARTAAESAYLLLLPVVLFFAYRVSPIDQVGTLDPWVYTGFIHNFEDLVARYGLTYYSVRFGLIFPHLVLAKLIGPVAGYLTFCYLMYLLAGVPLYLLFRKRYSIEAAMFAYALLASSAWFARSVLWTHPDAAAVPYMIAAVSLLLLDPPCRRLNVFLIGVLFALAANSNMFTLAISGLSGVPYVILHAGRLRERLAGDAFWALAGFASVFALGAIGYLACCDNANFVLPTWNVIQWLLSGAGEMYRVKYSTIVHTYLYVYVPLVLAAGLAVGAIAIRKHDRLSRACAGYFFAALAFAAWRQLFGKAAFLELFYYFCFLMPPTIICAALLAVRLNTMAGLAEGRWWLLASTATLLSVPLLHVYGILNFLGIPLPLLLAFSGVVLALMAAARWIPLAAPLAAVAFSAGIHTYWIAPSTSFSYFLVPGKRAADELDAYRLALRLIDVIPRFKDDGKPVWFWYPDSDHLLHSLQATYLWGYSRLSPGPGMPVLEGTELNKLAAGSQNWLVLIDRTRDRVAAGMRALTERGVILNRPRDLTLCSGSLCIEVTISSAGRAAASLPFPGSGGVSGHRQAHLLFSMQAPSFVPQLQVNLYGRFRRWQNKAAAWLPGFVPAWTLAQVAPDGQVFFRPTTMADHLATQFFDIVREEAGGGDFRLRIRRDVRFAPSRGCRIVLQNEHLETMLDTGCRDPEGASVAESVTVFRPAKIPGKARVVFLAPDGRETALPVAIELEQAVRMNR